jgi:hypothetical protein
MFEGDARMEKNMGTADRSSDGLAIRDRCSLLCRSHQRRGMAVILGLWQPILLVTGLAASVPAYALSLYSEEEGGLKPLSCRKAAQ